MSIGCLQALAAEPEKAVQHAIAQLVAVIAKHELPKGPKEKIDKWPELFSFLGSCYTQGSVDAFQLGMYCISVLSETAGEHIVKQRIKVCSVHHTYC